jgi:hypothetical protein
VSSSDVSLASNKRRVSYRWNLRRRIADTQLLFDVSFSSRVYPFVSLLAKTMRGIASYRFERAMDDEHSRTASHRSLSFSRHTCRSRSVFVLLSFVCPSGDVILHDLAIDRLSLSWPHVSAVHLSMHNCCSLMSNQ